MLRTRPGQSLTDRRKADLDRWLSRTPDVAEVQAELSGRLAAFDGSDRVDLLTHLLEVEATRIRTRRVIAAAFGVLAALSTLLWLGGFPTGMVVWMSWVAAGLLWREGRRWRNLLGAALVCVQSGRDASLPSVLRLLEAIGAPRSGVATTSAGPIDRHRQTVAAVRDALSAKLGQVRADDPLDDDSRRILLRAFRTAAAEYGSLDRDDVDLTAFLVASLLVLGDHGVGAAEPLARNLEDIARSARLKAAAQECLRAIGPVSELR